MMLNYFSRPGLAFIFIFSCFILLLNTDAKASSLSIKDKSQVKISVDDLPTIDNFANYVRSKESKMNPNLLGAKRSELEKNIILSLKDDPTPFLNDLSVDAINLLLNSESGLLIARRLDNLLVQATQDLSDLCIKELRILKPGKKISKSTILNLEKIKSIEVKRDALAVLVAHIRKPENFNDVFEFMLFSTYRIPNAVSRGLTYPPLVLKQLWPDSMSPYQTSYSQLRGMIIEILQGDPKTVQNEIRRMKLKSTGQVIPAFQPLYQQILKEYEKSQRPRTEEKPHQ